MDSTPISEPLIERFAASKPLRTGSLIVSIFGDSIAPRGGEVALASLIDALAPLGISHRLVRTAVYRLVQDNLLTNQQFGRRSFYTLTEAGTQQFEEATQRIYAEPVTPWNGRWCLVLTGLLDTEQRVSVRKDLAWLGFGQFGADTLAHPTPDRQRLERHLGTLGVTNRCLTMDADTADSSALQALVAEAWNLDALSQAYQRYRATFEPVLAAVEGTGRIGAADAFYIRTFMIHEYRKVLLRDPALPAALLPDHWNGHAAYTLTRALYDAIWQPSEEFVQAHFEQRSGKLPPHAESFYERFEGLTRRQQSLRSGTNRTGIEH